MRRSHSRAAGMLLLLAAAGCLDQSAIVEPRRDLAPGDPASGEHFTVTGSPTVYLSYGGARYAHPNQATTFACTGSYPGIVREVATMPALATGGTLPSVLAHEWLSGAYPVKGASSPEVYVVVGCIKNPIADLDMLIELYGPAGLSEVVEVAQAVVDSVPTGPAARTPLRRAGTLIKGSGPEVRWVSYMGGSLAIPDGATLDSYCRFGASRVPDVVPDDEFASYPAQAMMTSSSSDCATTQPPIVINGEFYRVSGAPDVFLAQRGKAYRIPDEVTLNVCTGGYASVVRELPRAPALRDGGTLPSAGDTANNWLTGDRAVRTVSNPAVYVLVGCTRSPIPDSETLYQLFGPSAASRTKVVADSMLAKIPGAAVARLPVRRAGTLIRTLVGPEIRWITHVGGALGVPDLDVLRSHCRTSVVTVSQEEFDAYPSRGAIEAAAGSSCSSPSVLQPDFRLPVPGGKAWLLVGSAGAGENTGVMRFSLDIDDRTEGLPGNPPVDQLDVAVLAAAAGTVTEIGTHARYGTYVRIDHGLGFHSIYGHLQPGTVEVGVNDVVERGDVLGVLGSSGMAPDTRLHFEVRYFDQGETVSTYLNQLVIEGQKLVDYLQANFYLSSNTDVSLVVDSVVVAPASDTITAGNTLQLTATVLSVTGDTLSDSVTWGSSATGVATVSPSGLVTGVAPGTATITATSGDKSGNAQITVVSAVSMANECDAPQPGWIWCDDFSVNRISSYFEYHTGSGRFVRADGVGVDNSYGMRATFQQGAEENGNLKLAFGRTPDDYIDPVDAGTADYREIYWRVFLRNQPTWTGGAGYKLSRAMVYAAPSWAQAAIGHVYSSGTKVTMSLDPVSGTDAAGVLKTTRYNDFANFRYLGAKEGTTPLFDAAHVGQWYCIEARMKLNDAGLSNGIFQFWVNGNLEASSTTLNWLGSYNAYGINAVFLENYWNGGAPVTQQRYFDNFVVSTMPIGCGG